MQRWTIRDDRRRWKIAPTVAMQGVWVDDPEVASLHYEGPHGPASIAYFDGFTRTRVWGPKLPSGDLTDGPPLAQDQSAKYDRLKAGATGQIGGTPLTVAAIDFSMRRSKSYVAADLGGIVYRFRLRGFPIVRVQLERPDSTMAWRYGVRSGRHNRAPDDVSPDEVCLALLLWSTAGLWAPML